MHRGVDAPSPFVVAALAELRATRALGPCLDLACGRGRHARLLAREGLRVVALDRDADSLRAIAGARSDSAPIAPVRADAEALSGLPFRNEAFGAVVVTRFLFRPLLAALPGLLAAGGLLVYETFTERQRELGQGPRNPAFLLAPGELERSLAPLRVLVAREELRDGGGGDRAWLAGVVARRAS